MPAVDKRFLWSKQLGYLACCYLLWANTVSVQAQAILAAPEAVVVESRVPVSVAIGQAQIDVSGYTLSNNAPALFPVGTTVVRWTADEDAGDGLETAEQRVFVVAPAEPVGATFFVDKHHPAASDDNAGTQELPWQTIQHAADILTAGQRVYVKAGIYTELSTMGQYVPAIVPAHSGIVGQPIIYEAFPGDKVIIDQRTGLNAQGNSFEINSLSDIVIRGFELRHAPIKTRAETSYARRIVIENNHIHDVTTTAGNNIGLIMPYGCMGCVIRNNILHGSYLADDPSNGNASAIHVYVLQNSLIENNEIYDSRNGIFVKNFQSSDRSERLGSVFRRNLIHDTYRGIWFSVAGAGQPGHRNHTISHNIFSNNFLAITSNPFDAGESSVGQVIRNNLFVGPNIAFATKGFSGLENYDNIFYKSGRFGTDNVQASNHLSGIDFSDFNLFFQNSNRFYLNLNGSSGSPPSEQNFFSLSAWQAAQAIAGGITFDHPDVNSFEADPLFVDAENGDYHLQATSPARNAGRFGANIGPYVTGTEVIGPSINTGPDDSAAWCFPVKAGAGRFSILCL